MSEAQMETEQHASVWARLVQHVRNTLWRLLDHAVSLSLLLVAMIEAGLSLFFGSHFALVSLSTAAVAIGLILAHGSLAVQHVGSIVQQIQRQYDEELKKVAAEPQRRTVPEPPLSWRN